MDGVVEGTQPGSDKAKRSIPAAVLANAVGFAFQLSRRDLVALLSHLEISEADEKSVLRSLVDEARGGTAGKTDADLGVFVAESKVATTLAILARPLLLIETRIGGGSHAIEFLTACHAPEIDPEAVATVLPSVDGAFLFLLHDLLDKYLAWWLDAAASRAQSTPPARIPPALSLESTVYILHAIDLFRRRAYEGLLAHETTDLPSVKVESFADQLLLALKKRDMRWLTPAFIGLTPGLSFDGFGKSEEPIAQLARLDILRVGTGAEGSGRLVFGEVGKKLGVEFYHTWFKAAGFAISVRARNGWTTVDRVFLAPTGLANHLFRLTRTNEDGTCQVEHRPLTRDLLDDELARMLALAMAAISSDGLPDRHATGISPGPSARADAAARPQRDCTSCATPLRPEDKFCANCGTPVADRRSDAQPAANGGRPLDLPE